MKKKIFILLFFCLSAFMAISQTDGIAIIRSEGFEMFSNNSDEDLSIIINGNNYKLDNKDYQFPVKINTMDYFCLSKSVDNKACDTIYAEFRHGLEYVIGFNSCSIFEIVERHKSGVGEIRFISINNVDELIVVSQSLFDDIVLTGNDTTEYFVPLHSAMCPNVPVSMSFYVNNKTAKNDDEVFVDALKFQFLHNEKLSVIYDGQKQEVYLIID